MNSGVLGSSLEMRDVGLQDCSDNEAPGRDKTLGPICYTLNSEPLLS